MAYLNLLPLRRSRYHQPGLVKHYNQGTRDGLTGTYHPPLKHTGPKCLEAYSAGYASTYAKRFR